MRLRRWVAGSPTRSDYVVRWAVATAVVTGAIGAVVGLAVGLAAYPPTAWFAVLEVGVPAALVGALAGAAAGAVLAARRRRTGG